MLNLSFLVREECSEQRQSDRSKRSFAQKEVRACYTNAGAHNGVTDPVTMDVDSAEAHKRNDDEDGPRVTEEIEVHSHEHGGSRGVTTRHRLSSLEHSHVAEAADCGYAGRALTATQSLQGHHKEKCHRESCDRNVRDYEAD